MCLGWFDVRLCEATPLLQLLLQGRQLLGSQRPDQHQQQAQGCPECPGQCGRPLTCGPLVRPLAYVRNISGSQVNIHIILFLSCAKVESLSTPAWRHSPVHASHEAALQALSRSLQHLEIAYACGLLPLKFP